MEIIKAKVPEFKLSIDKEATTERDLELQRSQTISTITNASESDSAGRRCKALKTLANDVEKNRKAFKAKVAEIGKQIDKVAADFVAPIDVELKRVGALMTAWMVEEQERVNAENARIEAERKAKLEAEAKAKADAEAALEKATSEDASLSDIERAAMAEAAVEEAKEEASEAIRMKEAERHKATGTSFRDVVCWEITDQAALFKTHPHWFKIVPMASVINNSVTKDTHVDGLKVWTEKRTSFRG